MSLAIGFVTIAAASPSRVFVTAISMDCVTVLAFWDVGFPKVEDCPSMGITGIADSNTS